jgi:hypothetical protein
MLDFTRMLAKLLIGIGMPLALGGCSVLFTSESPDASAVDLEDGPTSTALCNEAMGQILLSEDFSSGLGSWTSAVETDVSIQPNGQDGNGFTLCAGEPNVNLDARLNVMVPDTLPSRFALSGWSKSAPPLVSGIVLLSRGLAGPSEQHPAPPIPGTTDWAPFNLVYDSIDDTALEDLQLIIRTDPAGAGACLHVDSLCLAAEPK